MNADPPPTPLSEVVVSVLATGRARMTLSALDAELLANVMDSAPEFFGRSEESKRRHTGDDVNFGYRPMGIEHSVTAERPDVNESFTVWSDRVERVANHTDVGPFLDHIVVWQTRLSEIVTALFAAFVDALGGKLHEPVAFARASHVQVNSGLAAPADRTLLQDCHEDGHLVTILHATQAGLEIGCDTDSTPTVLAANELLVMPGSMLTLVSDDRVPALFHQVRNHGIVGRISIMYFVNPQLDRPMYQWTRTDGEPMDLRATIENRPTDFGLPTVPMI